MIMWCINVSNLVIGMLGILTIFNFIVIMFMLFIGVGHWNKTADIVNPNRWFNNYRYNEVESIKSEIARLAEYISKIEKSINKKEVNDNV